MEKIPSITSMDIHAVEPTDPSRGGVDADLRLGQQLQMPPYAITNLTTDRTYDANSTSTAELADVLGTLVTDLNKILKELNTRLRRGGL